MKKEAAIDTVRLALGVLIMILLSWPMTILIWQEISISAGLVLLFFSLLLTIVGWPFAGVLLLMVFLRPPMRPASLNLVVVSVLLWLAMGAGLAYVNSAK
jgi:hypothetical protein